MVRPQGNLAAVLERRHECPGPQAEPTRAREPEPCRPRSHRGVERASDICTSSTGFRSPKWKWRRRQIPN